MTAGEGRDHPEGAVSPISQAAFGQVSSEGFPPSSPHRALAAPTGDGMSQGLTPCAHDHMHLYYQHNHLLVPPWVSRATLKSLENNENLHS